MLSALLLAGLFAAPLATVALFVPTERRPRREEKPSKWLGRLALALAWSAVLGAADAAVRLVDELSGSGTRLPADWANLEHDRLNPIANPGGGAGVQYSFDAARLPIWFATACTAHAQHVAANWWRHVLGSDGRSGPQALALDGATINPAPSPVFLMAGAAAATAAGEMTAARDLRRRAAALAHTDPTYYGDAWVALGPALLDRSIDPCQDA